MKSQKVCILPFTKEHMCFINDCPEGYEIVSLISPCKGHDGMDVSKLINCGECIRDISIDIDTGIDECDIVLITDINYRKDNNELYSFVKQGIEIAINKKKKVICFSSLELEDKEKYTNMCKEHGNEIYFFNYPEINNSMLIEMNKIEVPIIFIGEMIPNCDGYEIFIKLVKRMEKDRIKVLAISEDKYNVLYGQYSVKFWGDYDPEANIKNLNQYISDLEKQIKPDVIIIKLPKPMLAYNNTYTFDFGMTANMISNSVDVDYFLLCGLCGFMEAKFIENINNSFKEKFGYFISAIHFSNQVVDNTGDFNEILKTIYLPLNEIQEKVKQFRMLENEKAYNLFSNDDFDEVYDEMIKEVFDRSYGVIL